MANVQHSTMAGSDLHEPKGSGSASVNTTYVSNGAGSGTWQKIGSDQINTSSVKNVNKVYLTYLLQDISTAASHWIATPIAGDIAKIYSVINGAITGANCALSFEIGGVAVTNGGITITQSGSAAGDVDTSTPSAAKTLAAGGSIEIITDGGSTGSKDATITFEINVA